MLQMEQVGWSVSGRPLVAGGRTLMAKKVRNHPKRSPSTKNGKSAAGAKHKGVEVDGYSKKKPTWFQVGEKKVN